MQINFKANYIDTVPLRYCKQGTFVEINPKNPNDFSAVEKVAKYWNTKFMTGILYCAKGSIKETNPKIKIFAITKQVDNFEKLNPDDILAMTETRNLSQRQLKIDFLQVNPLNKKEGLGTAMINYLKAFSSCKEILTHPVEDAMNFYHKLGFRPVNGMLNWVLKK